MSRSLWKNPAGFPLVFFFLIGGVIFTITMPEIFIGQIWIVVSLALGALFVYLTLRGRRAQRLRREGIPGEAQVLGMEQTGVYVNEQPQVKLRLHVEADGVQPFEVEKRVTVPMIALGTLTSGRPLPVYLDPEDHQEFVIDWGMASGPVTLSLEGGPPVSITDPAARQAVIDAMRSHGIDADGEVDLRSNPAARQAVLDALRRHGVEGVYAKAARDAETPVTEPPQPLDRLQKLMELKNAQLITDEEFAEHKRRILGQL